MNTTYELAPLVPNGCPVVCESGIQSGEDVRRLMGSGVTAVLVGTSIMMSGDMGEKARELVDAGG